MRIGTSVSVPTCGGASFPARKTSCTPPTSPARKLVRLNVDTEHMTDVCSYDPWDGRDLSHVRVMGWTTDSKLIVTLGDNNGDVIPEKGGVGNRRPDEEKNVCPRRPGRLFPLAGDREPWARHLQP